MYSVLWGGRVENKSLNNIYPCGPVNQPEYQSTNQPETPSIDKSAAHPNNQSTLEVGNSPQHTPR